MLVSRDGKTGVLNTPAAFEGRGRRKRFACIDYSFPPGSSGDTVFFQISFGASKSEFQNAALPFSIPIGRTVKQLPMFLARQPPLDEPLVTAGSIVYFLHDWVAHTSWYYPKDGVPGLKGAGRFIELITSGIMRKEFTVSYFMSSAESKQPRKDQLEKDGLCAGVQIPAEIWMKKLAGGVRRCVANSKKTV